MLPQLDSDVPQLPILLKFADKYQKKILGPFGGVYSGITGSDDPALPRQRIACTTKISLTAGDRVAWPKVSVP